MAYIYQIQNDINGKLYVGKTEFSIEKRFKEHCNDAFKEISEKRPLYSAMKKYGIEHFHISLIEETDNPEEREKYWIEYLETFKSGYNATMGGDGKRYIDYDLVVKTYNEVQNRNKTAKLLNISPDSVSNILTIKNIKILPFEEVNRMALSKKVGMYQKGDLIKVFSSLTDAGKFLQLNQLTLDKKIGSVVEHISQVCRNKRKSAYGYQWKFL